MTESYFRLMRGNERKPNEAVIAELYDWDEIDYDRQRYITNRKFETEDAAMEFAREVYRHSECPEHIKMLLESLVVTSQLNVDSWFDG